MEDFDNSYIKPDILKSLESSTDSTEIYKSLIDIFKSAFISNCNLDDASVTEEELQTLEELNQVEVVDNIKNLMETLLNFKSNCKLAKEGELVLRCDLLEKMLQKQESEVRNHIKIEHQLKLHIESAQQRILELEMSYNESQALIKEMEGKGLENIQTKLKKIEAKFQSELNKVTQDYREGVYQEAKYNEKIKKLEEMFEKKEKAYVKLLHDYNKVKKRLEESVKDYEKLKNGIKGYKSRSVSTEFKIRKSSFNDELNKVQQLNNLELRDGGKIDKQEIKKNKNFDFKIISSPKNWKIAEPVPPPLELKQNSLGKIGKYSSRRHIRSSSDSSKTVSSRKSKFKNK